MSPDSCLLDASMSWFTRAVLALTWRIVVGEKLNVVSLRKLCQLCRNDTAGCQVDLVDARLYLTTDTAGRQVNLADAWLYLTTDTAGRQVNLVDARLYLTTDTAGRQVNLVFARL